MNVMINAFFFMNRVEKASLFSYHFIFIFLKASDQQNWASSIEWVISIH